MDDLGDDNSVTGDGELKGDRRHVGYLNRLIHDIEALSSQEGHLNIVLKNARKKPTEYEVRTTLTTGAIGKGFTDAAIRSIRNSIEVRPYDATYSCPKGTIQVLSCDETPHLQDVTSKIDRSDNEVLKLSELKKDRGITAFAFTVSMGKYNLTIWGKMNSSKVLDPARYFMFSTKEGRFEAISEKFVVVIPNRVDALSNTSDAYIFDHGKFESIFEFKEGFIASIGKSKNKLDQLVSNPEELVNSCAKKLDSTRKLFGVLANLDQRKLTPEVAKKISKAYKLNIKFDSGDLIDVSASSVSDIIRLLDDDLVKSAQDPKRKYITHGKTPAL